MIKDNKNINVFIITRFNIVTSFREGGENVKNIDTCTDVNYLEERIRLFTRYTVPSIKVQEYKNFKWIVLFSDKTPDLIKKEINRIDKDVEQFEALYINENQAYNLSAYLKKTVEERLTSSFCLTIRLDNDDAVSSCFVQDYIQFIEDNNLYSSDTTVLYYEPGIQYNESKDVATKYLYKDNHFIALFERSENIKTIFAYDHKDLYKKLNSYSVGGGQYYWIEVLHGTNYGNITHQTLKNYIPDMSAIEEFKHLQFSVPEKILKKKVWLLFQPLIRVELIIKRHGFFETIRRIIYRIINKSII